jgi:hypothetical protein
MQAADQQVHLFGTVAEQDRVLGTIKITTVRVTDLSQAVAVVLDTLQCVR